MRNKKKKEWHFITIVLNIGIVFMIFLVILAVCMNIGTYQEEMHAGWNSARFLDNIKNEDFNYCVEGYYKNQMNGYKANRELEECYGVAQYFEASYWYRVYDVTGQTKKAEEAVKKRKTARAAMGSLSVVADHIDEILEK